MTIVGIPIELVTVINAALNVLMLAALWWAIRSGERRASEAQQRFLEDLRHALSDARTDDPDRGN